jgi:K+-sensing histidine kinase KdpD
MEKRRHIRSRVVGLRAARLTWRIVAALAAIAAITYFFFRVVPVNATSVGFFYLVAILTIAAAGGLVESTLASIVAMLCFNYFFLPPIGTFTIADPRNWVALFAFLATSLMASQLSARAKRRTAEAIDRQRELERLYSLSRGLLLTDATQPIARPVVLQITQAFESAAVALYDRGNGEIYRANIDDVPDLNSGMREVAVQSTSSRGSEDLRSQEVHRHGAEIGLCMSRALIPRQRDVGMPVWLCASRAGPPQRASRCDSSEMPNTLSRRVIRSSFRI